MLDVLEQRRLARKARRHARAREELIQAARKILAEQGLLGFTIKAVAEAADVSKPAFYYYYDSREALMAELADRILARESAVLVEAAYRAETGSRAASEVLREKVRFYKDDLDSFRVVYLWSQVIGMPPGFDEEVLEPRRRQVIDVLSQRLGETGMGASLAEVVLATAHGLLATVAAGGDMLALDRLTETAALAMERAC